MPELFRGKVALVTGAASGIGRATALAFAEAGASVVVSDVNPTAGEETVADIRRAGGKAIFVPADVGRSEDVQTLIRATIKSLGRLDVAFNNAGIEGAQLPTAQMTEEAFRRIIEVNLNGVFYCMKYEITEMLKTGGGAIVNNASILGLVGFANAGAYTATKHGIIGLTQCAASEYAASNIRVNAVCPGFVDTPMLTRAGVSTNLEFLKALLGMVPMKRLGKPEEIAKAVLWLSSDQASFVTGHPLVVDGAYLAQ